jgi:hypothetical protein
MEVRSNEGYDLRVIAKGAVRLGYAVGDGAAALGLSGM